MSSLPVEQEAFLHSLSSLVDPLTPAASPPSPPLQPSTRSLTYVDSHIAHYQHFIRATAGSTSAAAGASSASTIQSQLNTLILLHHLRSAEDTITATLTTLTAPVQPLDSQYSDRNKVLNIIASSATLLRSLAVIDWLEELADSDVLVEREGAVGWKRTLRRLQRAGDSSDEQLGLDVESVAGRRVLDEADREDEALLLRYVWQLMRAGRMQDAIALCVAFKQPWRAASISGGQLWHIDSAAVSGASGATGNKQHFLFKHSCKLLSSAPHSSTYERAVYGLLGSEATAVLPVCRSWEDCVWSMYRVMVDREIDTLLTKQLKDISEQRYAQQLTLASNATVDKPAAVFERIARGDDAVPAVAKQSATSLYHRLQTALVLGEYDRAEQLLVEAVKERADDELLPFATHVYLYLHPTASTSTLTPNGLRLLTAYIAYLRRQRLYPLVPIYAAYLPAESQVAEYAAFLRELGSLAQRQDYLALANHYFSHNTLAITSRFVQSVIDEHSPQLRLTGATTEPPDSSRLRVSFDSGAVSVSDMFRIECLDCFSIAATVTGKKEDRLAVLEAMRLSCLLFRSFMRADKLNAAKALSDALLRKKFDQFIAMDEEEEGVVGNEAEIARSEMLQSQRPRVEHEYVGWMRYVGAMRWYAAWASKLAVRPSPPPPLLSAATVSAADARRHEREVSRYRDVENEWRRGWDEVTTATIDAVLTCLQQDGVGWMKRGGSELEEWRRELIPRLVFLLLHVCEVGERGEEGMRVVDVVVDERFRLYEAMEIAERRAIMRKCKDGYVRWELKTKEERRRLRDAALGLRGESSMEAGEEKYGNEAEAGDEKDQAVIRESREEKRSALSTVVPRSSSVPHQRSQRGASRAREVPVALATEQTTQQQDEEQGQTLPDESERQQREPQEFQQQQTLELDEQMEVEEHQLELPADEDIDEPSNEPVVGPATLAFVPPLQPSSTTEDQDRDDGMRLDEPPATAAIVDTDTGLSLSYQPHSVLHSPHLNPFQAQPVQVVSLEPASLQPAAESMLDDAAAVEERPRRATRSSSRLHSVERDVQPLQPVRRGHSLEAEDGAPGSPASSVAESVQSELSSVPEEGGSRARRSMRKREPKKPMQPSTRVLRSKKS